MPDVSRDVKSFPDPVKFGGAPGKPAKKSGHYIITRDVNGRKMVVAHFPKSRRGDALRFSQAWDDSSAVHERHVSDVGAVERGRRAGITELTKRRTVDEQSKNTKLKKDKDKDRAELIDEALLRVASEGGGSKADSLLAGSRLQHLLPQAQIQAMLELTAKKAAAGRVPPEEKESEEIRKAQELQARDRVDVMTDWTPTKLGDRVTDLTRELAAAMKALEKDEEDLKGEDVLELDRERITALQMHLNEALEAQGRQSKRQRPKE